MNTLFCSEINDFWFDVLKSLKSNSNVNTVYWVGSLKTNNKIDGCFVHDAYYAYNVECGYCIKESELPQVLLSDFSRSEYFNYLKILDRVDIGGSFTFSERDDLFKRQIAYWTYVLVRDKIDLVFFSNAPHLPYDYPIYLVAKKLGLKVLMFNVTPVLGWHYLTESIGDYPRILNKEVDSIENLAVVQKEFLDPFLSNHSY